jgi:predicted esterase
MLPKILCLHGGGSNGGIFKIQTARLRAQLRSHFEFVFLDAPRETSAGPGILPFFEGGGPFRSWTDGVDPARLREFLLEAVRSQGPFVGVLGFSQGAKTAVSLCLLPEDLDIRFAVLLCGTAPPADLVGDNPGQDRNLGRVGLPTIHLIADNDPFRPRSEMLKDYCEPSTRLVIRFEGGHHLPTDAGVNARLAGEIVRAYQEEGVVEGRHWPVESLDNSTAEG